MPTSINENHIYAGLGARFFAFILDSAVKWIFIGFAWLFFIASGFTSADSVMQIPILFEFSALNIAAYLVGAAYFIFFTYACGATLGKLIMRIKVIPSDPADGGRLSLFNVIYRETVGRYLSGLFYLGYIIAPFHPRKQALHDILGGTFVVYSFKTPKPKPAPPAPGSQYGGSPPMYAQDAQPHPASVPLEKSAPYNYQPQHTQYPYAAPQPENPYAAPPVPQQDNQYTVPPTPPPPDNLYNAPASLQPENPYPAPQTNPYAAPQPSSAPDNLYSNPLPPDNKV